MNPHPSGLKFYSVGYAAHNKRLSTDILEVVPVEVMPAYDGEVNDIPADDEQELKDIDGKTIKVKGKQTHSIQAKWLDGSDYNRITPPDVRRGDLVVLHQFSDSPEYWWSTLRKNPKIPRLETVVWRFSNTKSEDETLNANNSYWMEMSTHRKLVHLRTNKNDGEPFRYDVQINAKEGIINISDDADNWIILDSTNTRIMAHNKDNTFADLNKRDMYLNAPDLIRMTCTDLEIFATESILQRTRRWTTEDERIKRTTKIKAEYYQKDWYMKNDYYKQEGKYWYTDDTIRMEVRPPRSPGPYPNAFSILGNLLVHNDATIKGNTSMLSGVSHPQHEH